MKKPGLILFDDRRARSWHPFALTRPAGELLFGAHTARQRAELRFELHCTAHLSAEHLIGFEEPGAPPVVDAAALAVDHPRVLLHSRAVLAWQPAPAWPAGPATFTVDGRVAGWFLPAGAPLPDPAVLLDPDSHTPGDAIELGGHLIENLWDLISGNPDQLRADIAARRARGGSASSAPDHLACIGPADGALVLGEDVTIEPGCVFDVSHGPVWLDDRVTVRAFTRLAGPAYVGPDSTLLGGPYDEISVGPVCKVHGEIEASIICGYSNKAHDGFLGHALLGRWVNLGALTTNSDLKNNYGTIRIWTPDGDVDTGEIKIGCMLGDHVKTGIGTMINTGTVVGAGSNLFGGAMPPKYVPPFSWGSGSDLVAFDADRFLAVAETVMGRRKLTLSATHRDQLARAWRIGREGL